MSYLEFERTLYNFPVFSIKDIRKRFVDFDSRRLVEWQKKGYLIQIRQGYYCFSTTKRDENFIRIAANKIYSPSYISLESALSFYGLIPEGVFTTTSVTTKYTVNYQTAVGNFNYRHIKNRLFFGYRLVKTNNLVVKMAEPEKAILDFLYLNKIQDVSNLEGLRLNMESLKELIDTEKMENYQSLFSSKALDKRVTLLLNFAHA